MEEMELSNDELIIEALDFYWAYLERLQTLETKKAVRSISDKDFEKHDAVAVMARQKQRAVEGLLKYGFR